MPLIEKVNGYDIIYSWFDILKTSGHFINGFVIMPNHVHALISFTKTNRSINTIIGNEKRFMAYEVINRLRQNNEIELLSLLARNVEAFRRLKNKKHDVWKLSFDWKECNSTLFIDQKLNYIHNNPCSGKWDLCTSPIAYEHSSAKFYLAGEQGKYEVTNVSEMQDVEFERKAN
jgi:REP element-mobilizing transposase RayT